MGPHIREDNGRGRAVPEPSLRGSRRARRRWATTRVAPTKTGMGVGGVGKMGPRPRLHEGRLSAEKRRWGMGPRIREDNGRGRAVPEPPPRWESPNTT